MKLINAKDFAKLLQNGKPENSGKDHVPVVKLFLPGSNCTWLLTEIDPYDKSIAFGLCDLGMGFPELGSVSLDEITSVKSRWGLSVERDKYFKGQYPISVYARAASTCEMITDNDFILSEFVRK